MMRIVLMQAMVLGMMISFPIQGYALFSILFSSLHMLFTYWFVVLALKEFRKQEDQALAPTIQEAYMPVVLIDMVNLTESSFDAKGSRGSALVVDSYERACASFCAEQKRLSTVGEASVTSVGSFGPEDEE